MDCFKQLGLVPGNAICYSGFRDGQQPGVASPSYYEVKDDLLILQNNWKYLRLFDCDEHAETVIDIIRNENLYIKIMFGVNIESKMNSFGCPWGGGVYDEKQLKINL